MKEGRQLRDLTFKFQHGAISGRQLEMSGLSRRQIQHSVITGRLLRPFAGVLELPGTPDTWLRSAWGAICWAGEGSAISGPAAARAMRMDGFSLAPVQVSITRHKNSSSLPFEVRRVDSRLLPEIIEIDGLPVTSVRRTVLDLAGKKHPRTTQFLHQAFRRRLTGGRDMWIFAEQEFQRGRRGIAILRNELKLLTGTEHLTHSHLENMFIRKARTSQLELPVPQHPLVLPSHTIHVDFAYPERNLGIELDSGFFHDGDPVQPGIDKRRDAEAGLIGWRVLRFTWIQVMYEWDYVEGTLRRYLERY